MTLNATALFNLEALGAKLRECGIRLTAPLTLRPLTGGQSNPTFVIEGADRPYVLRKRPGGTLLPSAHAIDREYRVMSALRSSTVPVPEMIFYCEDPSIVGTAFYVMTFLEGRVFVDQSLPGMSVSERGAIYTEMGRVISALHTLNPDALGLADFGRGENYLSRQIARWTRQYNDSCVLPGMPPGTLHIPAMERLIEWLPQHVPPSDRVALVHGDFRLDNLVFHPSKPTVIGVLDWELSTLGDPLVDFAYHAMSWHIPADLWRGIGGLDLPRLGIPSEADYLQRYTQATGISASDQWYFVMAYNLFRMAAILQGIARRAADGNAAAADAAETGRRAAPLAELGWTCALRHQALIGNSQGASHVR